ncbi:hypothetical protein OHV08_10675 [Streptomyces canus]
MAANAVRHGRVNGAGSAYDCCELRPDGAYKTVSAELRVGSCAD